MGECEGHVEEAEGTQLEGSCPRQCQQQGEVGGTEVTRSPPSGEVVKHDRMQRADNKLCFNNGTFSGLHKHAKSFSVLFVFYCVYVCVGPQGL